MARTLAIGDIHGSLPALLALEEFVEFTTEDEIITLGDYVDRGVDSKGVFDWLMDREKKLNLTSLIGNHEVMMENATTGLMDYRFWMMNGGLNTLHSFEGDIDEVPQLYWDFIDQLKPFYETEEFIFVHAGADPLMPLEGQGEKDLLWLRFHELKAHNSGKMIVCGHTPQRSHVPAILPYAICVDTHAFHKDGYLTCLDVKTGDYWQANNAGDTRKNHIDLPKLPSQSEC